MSINLKYQNRLIHMKAKVKRLAETLLMENSSEDDRQVIKTNMKNISI